MKQGGNDMRTVLDLSNVMAYKYFMEPANYCSVDLPIYIDFKPIRPTYCYNVFLVYSCHSSISIVILSKVLILT